MRGGFEAKDNGLKSKTGMRRRDNYTFKRSTQLIEQWQSVKEMVYGMKGRGRSESSRKWEDEEERKDGRRRKDKRGASNVERRVGILRVALLIGKSVVT